MSNRNTQAPTLDDCRTIDLYGIRRGCGDAADDDGNQESDCRPTRHATAPYVPPAVVAAGHRLPPPHRWPRPDSQHRYPGSALEEERRRLRDDIHDGLSGTLAGIRLRLDTAISRLGHDPCLRRLVVDAAAETARAVEEMRSALHGLVPPDLATDEGLTVALRRLASRAARASEDVLVVADLPFDPLPLAPVVEAAAYRIAAEGLGNALRHSGADTVTVRLRAERTCLVLDIQDDGVGIGQTVDRGTGLRSMRRRAEEVGGFCVVMRVPSGTLLRAMLPRGER
ncbi:histidine kinase [Kitasatospora sp. NPDC097691]|uniref:sensor histidine kinase n=1 Tax=Kitasatospora sp. NPDC097691 TaxID=3157231 RepID=UPI003318ACA9